MAITSPNDITERLTVEEYFTLAEQHDWTHVELEDGRVVNMAPEHDPHFLAVNRVKHALDGVFPWSRVFPSGTIRLSDFTAYDPDLWVTSWDSDHSLPLHPIETVVLVVEVANTSRARDLGRKAVNYAAAGIPEYWVIEPGPGILHRHTEPTPDGYATVVRFDVGAHAQQIDAGAILTIPSPGPRDD